MNATVIGVVSWLTLVEPKDDFSYESFILTTKSELINDLLSGDSSIVGNYGKIQFESVLHGKPFFFQHSDVKEVFGFGKPMNVMSQLNNQLLSNLTMALWLVKDNSVNIDAVLLWEPNQKWVHRRMIGYSNSSGNYEYVRFSHQEINQALDTLSRLGPHLKALEFEEDDTLYEESPISATMTSAVNLVPSKNFNRISRAFLFLQFARGTSMLGLKISNYVAILESLFNSGSDEVAHKVAERAAIYLSTEPIKREEIYISVRKAYKVRSLFVHGQRVKEADLKVVSSTVDSLIRSLFLKIIESHEVFEYQNAAFDEAFNRMLFN